MKCVGGKLNRVFQKTDTALRVPAYLAAELGVCFPVMGEVRNLVSDPVYWQVCEDLRAKQ